MVFGMKLIISIWRQFLAPETSLTRKVRLTDHHWHRKLARVSSLLPGPYQKLLLVLCAGELLIRESVSVLEDSAANEMTPVIPTGNIAGMIHQTTHRLRLIVCMLVKKSVTSCCSWVGIPVLC